MKGLSLAIIEPGTNALVSKGIVLDYATETTIIVRTFKPDIQYRGRVSLIVIDTDPGRTSVYSGRITSSHKDIIIIEKVQLITHNDRRRKQRFATNMNAVAIVNGYDFTAHVDDMSESGIAIDAPSGLKIGDLVYLQIPMRIDGETAIFTGSGKIVRETHEDGYGIKFEQLPCSNLFTLKSYIHRELS